MPLFSILFTIFVKFIKTVMSSCFYFIQEQGKTKKTFHVYKNLYYLKQRLQQLLWYNRNGSKFDRYG